MSEVMMTLQDIEQASAIFDAGGWEACREAMAKLVGNGDRWIEQPPLLEQVAPQWIEALVEALEAGGFRVHRSDPSAHAQKADYDFLCSGDVIAVLSPEAHVWLLLIKLWLDAEHPETETLSVSCH